MDDETDKEMEQLEQAARAARSSERTRIHLVFSLETWAFMAKP